MSELSLLERNLAFFEREFPDVHRQVTNIPAPLSKPVFVDGVAVDIDLGSGPLYRGDARELAKEQAGAFLASPFRIGYKNHEGTVGDSLVARDLFTSLKDSLTRHGVDTLKRIPVAKSGYLVVFGVGLGYHLPQLVEGLTVRDVIITEAIAEFMLASAQAIDWQALHEACEKSGKKLHVLLERGPRELAKMIDMVIEGRGTPMLDGSYFYRHYPIFTLDEAYKAIVEGIPRQMISLGYYEDERKMIRNAATNLHKTGFRLIEGDFRVITDVPAFIIGSGPSLDQSIEDIKRVRDQVVLFTCGSSLQACLKAGIVPDFHVELENVTAVYDMLTHIGERNPHVYQNGRFDKSIRLIASVTLNPRVPPLFEEVYFFFRDTSSSTTSFGEKVKVMTGVGPNVSNTAVACAARLGFTEMYLFGMDCGWRDESAQHSKDTPYSTSERFKDWKARAEVRLPGNFGGEVESDLILNWSRDMLEQKIRAFSCKVFNCSDGALINGAAPKLPEALDFGDRHFDRDKLIDAIRRGSPRFEAGEFLRDHDVKRYVGQVDAYRADIMAIIDKAQQDKLSFDEFHDLVWAMYRNVRTSPYRHISVLFHCASVGMIKSAAFFMNRVEDDAKRALVLEDFYAAFRRLHEEMLTEGRQIMEEIATMVEGGPEPEWTNGLPMVPGTTY